VRVSPYCEHYSIVQFCVSDRARFQRSDRGSDGKARVTARAVRISTELNGGKDMILILVVSIFTIAIVTVTVEIRFGKNR
jgi:hypothetical protein